MPVPMEKVKRRKKQRKDHGQVPSVPPVQQVDNEEEVVVSDEDVEFVQKHGEYLRFLADGDAKSMVGGVSEVKKDRRDLQPKTDQAATDEEDPLDPEAYFDRKSRIEKLQELRNPKPQKNLKGVISVEPQDVLPVKTLDGRLVFRQRASDAASQASLDAYNERRALVQEERGKDPERWGRKAPGGKIMAPALQQEKNGAEEGGEEDEEGEEGAPPSSQQLKKQSLSLLPDLSHLPLALRLGAFKQRIAESCTSLLAAPEQQLGKLKELQAMCTLWQQENREEDEEEMEEQVAAMAMLSLAAVYRDIVPGYRIRLPTEKELAMPISKDLKKLRDFETQLLRSYEAFLSSLLLAAKRPSLRLAAVRSMCVLLESLPHFNGRDRLLRALVPRMDAQDERISALCCGAVKEVLLHQGKHKGEAAVEAVELISDFVRQRSCRLHPRAIEVFHSLRFDDSLAPSSFRDAVKRQKGKRGRGGGEGGGGATASEQNSTTLLSKRQKKAEKKKLTSKLRTEVAADFRESSAVVSEADRHAIQSQLLSAVFETYFRVLKTTLAEADGSSSKGSRRTPDGSAAEFLGPRPLLPSSLLGLSRLSYLISADFMGDLLTTLAKLAKAGGAGKNPEGVSEDEEEEHLPEQATLSCPERLHCIVAAFHVSRSNLDALNLDMRAFLLPLYQMLLQLPVEGEEEEGREGQEGFILAQALQLSLVETRHFDMQRCAAFTKRLATSAAFLSTPDALAGLVTVRHLLQRYARCRALIDYEAGGGVVSASGAGPTTFCAEVDDPDLSGALSSVLWELPLLANHWHPAVARFALEIAKASSLSADPSPSNPPATSSFPASSGRFSPSAFPVSSTAAALSPPIPVTYTPMAAAETYGCVTRGGFKPGVRVGDVKRGRRGQGQGRDRRVENKRTHSLLSSTWKTSESFFDIKTVSNWVQQEKEVKEEPVVTGDDEELPDIFSSLFGQL